VASSDGGPSQRSSSLPPTPRNLQVAPIRQSSLGLDVADSAVAQVGRYRHVVASSHLEQNDAWKSSVCFKSSNDSATRTNERGHISEVSPGIGEPKRSWEPPNCGVSSGRDLPLIVPAEINSRKTRDSQLAYSDGTSQISKQGIIPTATNSKSASNGHPPPQKSTPSPVLLIYSDDNFPDEARDTGN